MKIVVCGSMTFIDRMESIAEALRPHAEAVFTPEREEAGVDWEALSAGDRLARKHGYLFGYLEVIRRSDVVLIANYEKHGVAGYVGPNSLVEAAFGHALGKQVAFLNLPGEQPCMLEARAMMTDCLDGDARRVLGMRSARSSASQGAAD